MARLPKSIIKKYGISKKAWRIFKGQKRKSPTRRTGRKSNPGRKRGVKRMGRRKRRRGGKSMIRTSFKLIRLGALVAPALEAIISPGTAEHKLHKIVHRYFGYDMVNAKFDFGAMAQGWGPYLGAILLTHGSSKIAGLIRKL